MWLAANTPRGVMFVNAIVKREPNAIQYAQSLLDLLLCIYEDFGDRNIGDSYTNMWQLPSES